MNHATISCVPRRFARGFWLRLFALFLPAVASATGAAIPLSQWTELLRREAAGGLPSAALMELPELGGAPAESVTAAAELLRDPSPFVRAHAVRVIGGWGAAPERAVPALVAALQDEDRMVRGQAMVALTRFGSAPQAALWDLLRSERVVGAGGGGEVRVRHLARAAFGRLPDYEPLPLLEELAAARRAGHWWGSELSPEQLARQQLVFGEGSLAHFERLLLQTLPQGSAATLAKLGAALAHGDDRVRSQALRLLRHASDTTAALPGLRQLVARGAGAERNEALRAMGRAGAAAVADLRSWSTDTDAATSAAAIAAFEELAVPLTELVVALAAETSPERKTRWLEALDGRLTAGREIAEDPSAAVPALVAALAEPAWRTGAAKIAGEILPRLPAETARVLSAALTAAVPAAADEEKSELIEALTAGSQPDPATLTLLCSTVAGEPSVGLRGERGEEVRGLAADKLGEFTLNAKTRTALEKAAKKFQTNAGRKAAGALARQGVAPKAALNHFTEAAKSRPGENDRAIEALSELGVPGRQRLAELAANRAVDERVRDDALRQLRDEVRLAPEWKGWAEVARKLPAREDDALAVWGRTLRSQHGSTGDKRDSAKWLGEWFGRRERFEDFDHAILVPALQAAPKEGSKWLLKSLTADGGERHAGELGELMKRTAAGRPAVAAELGDGLVAALAQLPGRSRNEALEVLAVAKPGDTRRALEQLVQLGDTALAREDSGEMGLVAGALANLGADAKAALSRLVEWAQRSPQVRASVFEALGRIDPHDERVRAALVRGLREDSAAGWAAAQALAPAAAATQLGEAQEAWGWTMSRHAVAGKAEEWTREAQCESQMRPATSSDRAGLETFPWPPPVYSDIGMFGLDFERALLGSDQATLDDVYRRAYRALQQIDARFVSELLSVGDGFALMTRIERIDRSGQPLPGDERWLARDERTSVRSLADFFSRIVFEAPGYYRTLVLVVANVTNQVPDAVAVLPEFRNRRLELPRAIAQRRFGAAKAYLLVYCYENRASSGPRQFPLGQRTHFERSGLAQALR